MYLKTDNETCAEIKKIIEKNSDKPDNIRVFIAGMGCGGPSLGLGLDEKKEDDIEEKHFDINFILEKSVYDKLGEIKITYQNNGYKVVPANQPESACNSCSGC
ncbi:MAG: Fe-S cluster assembly protein HesB [Bacillota bacterium]